MQVRFSRDNTNDVGCHVRSVSDECENRDTGDGLRTTKHYREAKQPEVSEGTHT